MRAGRRVEDVFDEDRNRRHCRKGTCVSWKALSNALDGAIDRDMLLVARGEELQAKMNSQRRRTTTKVSRHLREEIHQPMPLGPGPKSKAHHPKSCRKLGPICDFSKSCLGGRVESSVEQSGRQSALTPSTLHEAAKGMNY